MTSKINKSWERTRSDVHSPAGVESLRREVKAGLTRKYLALAESMFEYTGMDERFEDMNLMSRNTLPERYLLDNGECVFFTIGDDIHCLPMVMEGGLNIYGYPEQWRAVPVGWQTNGPNPKVWQDIYDRVLTSEDSVIMRNSRFNGSDKAYIESQVNMLVDNTMTLNQLQLLAKCPFVFNVSQDNLLSAKNFFLALSEDKPAIFTNTYGESPAPVVEAMGVKIDPSLFELFDRTECAILEYLGYPCVPITKRAQQSVSEVQSNTDKIYMRRMEKLEQREAACERMNDLFGTDVHCISVIDAMIGGVKDEEGEGSKSDGLASEPVGQGETGADSIEHQEVSE